jgi:hypothetical protein
MTTPDPTAGVRRWMRFFILVKVGLLILVAVAVWRIIGQPPRAGPPSALHTPP